MDIDSVINKLKQIISEELDVNLKMEEIKPDVSLFEDGLGFDSVIIVEFISLIEEHFGFKFLSEELDMELFGSLQLLAKFISSKLNSC